MLDVVTAGYVDCEAQMTKEVVRPRIVAPIAKVRSERMCDAWLRNIVERNPPRLNTKMTAQKSGFTISVSDFAQVCLLDIVLLYGSRSCRCLLRGLMS